MTIAAGFVVRDGVLLCSDTLYSSGQIREYRDKLFQWTGKRAAVAFAIAGNAANAWDAVEACQDALSATRRKALDSASIVRIVKPVIIDAYARHVDSRKKEHRDNAWFSILLAVATASDVPKLFESAPTALTAVPQFTCTGNGYDVGRHIIGLAYRPTMTIDEVSMLAILALGATKEIINGIGGQSQFLAMRRDSLSPVVPHDVNGSEPLALQYQREAIALFLTFGQQLSPENLRKRVDVFSSRAMELGARWQEDAAPWIELCAALSPKPQP